MKDLLKKLAEIDGVKECEPGVYRYASSTARQWLMTFNPLTNDAQAMALLRKLLVKGWMLYAYGDDIYKLESPKITMNSVKNKDLNICICETYAEAHK